MVIMDIAALTRHERMLKLRAALLSVEEERLRRQSDVTVHELDAYLDKIIGESEQETPP